MIPKSDERVKAETQKGEEEGGRGRKRIRGDRESGKIPVYSGGSLFEVCRAGSLSN